jgi:glycosyltransferase involved in cell wall biosynthesis
MIKIPRKKVLWLIKGLGRGGAERLLEASIPYFNREVFEYEVAYCLPQKNDIVPALEQANIPVFCVNHKSPLDIPGLYRLWRLVRGRRPDILHLHLPYTGIIGRLVGRLAGVKNTVYTEHNVFEVYHPVTRLLNLITYPLNKITIAVSEEVQRSIMKHWISRRSHPITIRNGVDADYLAAGTPPDKMKASLGIPSSHKVVGNVAHIRHEKGQEYLLQAARRVIEQQPEVTFVIVGREKIAGEIDRLKKMASELGIEKNIIFTGFREDIYDLMGIFDIFILSSLFEGLPIALLEAMSLGKPVVATAVGGIPEVIKDGVNGFLVPAKDPQLLAEKIVQLLKEDDLRTSFSQNAIRTIREHFSLKEMVRQVEEIYSSILMSR